MNTLPVHLHHMFCAHSIEQERILHATIVLVIDIISILFQIINVYNQEYESAAAFWPSVHGRIVTALIISQFLLLGLLSTKGAAQSTPMLLVLPVVTFYFHKYCKNRYEPTFVKCPLQVIFIFKLGC
jgi:hypothetical protein